MTKIMEFVYLEDIHIVFFLTVNKQITGKIQNVSYFIAEHSRFIKYTWCIQ